MAADELVVHGWDIAVATGQAFSPHPTVVEAAHGFVAPITAANPAGVPGLFDAAVPVAPDAPLLDRLIALTGREPTWAPPGEQRGSRDG